MKLSLQQVTECAAKTIGSRSLTDKVSIFTDTRIPTVNGLFIPIVGDRFDAHDFLNTAIESGAVAALWQSDHPLPSGIPEDFMLFIVEDTLAGLQALAKAALRTVQPKVIGITGSNGKTTTKDIIGSLLSTSYRTHHTKGNFNNHIGLPLTVLSMPEDCEVLVLEMGMNHFGEISLLSRIAEPDIAVITNIGESHIEFLGSRMGIAKAKSEITDGMPEEGLLVIDGDEPLLHHSYPNHIQVITCGTGEKNKLQISKITPDKAGYFFGMSGENRLFHIPLIGEHNVKNASYGLAVARTLGMNDDLIQQGFDHLSMTGMRLETLRGRKKTLLINDSYNASPTSMMSAIETVKQLPASTCRVLVLGDMYELGEGEEALHRQVADVIQSPITHVFVIGDKARWIGEEMINKKNPIVPQYFLNKEAVITELEQLLSPDTVILFKASRMAALETLVDALKLTH